jgi:hypothetical protein
MSSARDGAAREFDAGPVPGGTIRRHPVTGAPVAATRPQTIPMGADGAVAGREIRPATVELLRTARVAPPPALPVGRTSAVPEPPASALAGGRDAVIRRSPSAADSVTAGDHVRAAVLSAALAAFGGSAASGSGHRASSGAPPGSLIRRVPATLFDRARAELRAAARGPETGSPAGVIRRSDSTDVAPVDAAVVPAAGTGMPVRGSLSSREWDELVDEVVRRIEYRVTAELSRRGRRFIPKAL